MTSNTNRIDGMDMTDELINLLREIRPSFSDVGSRDVDTRRKQNQIDRAIELLSASKPAAMPGKDAVTREQVKAWAKLAGIPTVFEKHIEQLGDFAIFARMDYAASPAAPAQSGEPVAWVRYRSDGGFEGPIMETDERMCDSRRSFWTPLYAAPQPSQTAVVLDDERAACDAAYAKQAGNRRTDENDFGAGWECAIEWMQARAASPQSTATQPAQTRATVKCIRC